MGDWRETTLGEIASWSGGLTPSKSNPGYWEDGTPGDFSNERTAQRRAFI